jgi:hypothetical protein
MEITREYFDNTMASFSKRLDELVEVNKELVQQNLKLSDKVFNKYISAEVDVESSHKQKNLFYSESNGHIFISGGGTFDVKNKLKELSCDWVGEIKSWKYTGQLATLKAAFPDITQKNIAITIKNIQTVSKPCLVRD